MKPLVVITLGMLALGGCAPSHSFDIKSDEPIRAVEVNLKNVRESEIRIEGKAASVDIWSGDSSGEIRVHLASGKVAICNEGYITNGDPEPHVFTVTAGNCLPGYLK